MRPPRRRCLLLLVLLAACDGHAVRPPARQSQKPVRDFSRMTPDQIHAAIFEDEEEFPSAQSCARCHPQHFREWAASPHAYAQMSPVFNAMQGTVVKLTNGTAGDFCIRCHSPVGMQKNEPIFITNFKRHPASREGITCITCHRVNKNYGKISGRFGLVRGGLEDPVFGPEGGKRLASFIEKHKVRMPIHREVQPFFELRKPGFCGTCHDVNLPNGFRLEEAFSFYKTSPAARQGITCQDCHMGKTPGKPEGYAHGPAAIVNKKATPARRLTNHTMAGPDHSVLHPGLYPLNLRGTRSKLFRLSDWISFDYEAGWGLEPFEEREALRVDAAALATEKLSAAERAEELAALREEYGGPIPAPTVFPETWADPHKRREAAGILRENLQLLAVYARRRKAVLQAGFTLRRPELLAASKRGARFRVEVYNPTNGHNSPTGFIAERVLFLRVTVSDASGEVVFRSGDQDPNGDVRDLHSIYVHDGRLPRDSQLFTLQSRFLTRNLRGGEREQVLGVNYSISPLPFVRPSTFSAILTGRPAGARIDRQTLPPLAGRWASYSVGAEALKRPGRYTVRMELVAGMVPANLIGAIARVGFDYKMSARQIGDRVRDGVPWGPYRFDPSPGARAARVPDQKGFARYLAERKRGARRAGIGGHVVLAAKELSFDVR